MRYRLEPISPGTCLLWFDLNDLRDVALELSRAPERFERDWCEAVPKLIPKELRRLGIDRNKGASLSPKFLSPVYGGRLREIFLRLIRVASPPRGGRRGDRRRGGPVRKEGIS